MKKFDQFSNRLEVLKRADREDARVLMTIH